MAFEIFGIGEVLWDLLPAGRQLGGAPGNFVYHATALGGKGSLITRVGADDDGRLILKQLGDLGISTNLVQVDPVAPTGTVSVKLSEEGVPDFTIHTGVAWDRIEALPAALESLKTADAVCFGSLGQREDVSRGSIQRLLAATPDTCLRVFDINLRQHFYSREIIENSLRLSNILKLNDAELPVLANIFGLNGSQDEQLRHLAAAAELDLIALTRGSQGSLLFRGGELSDFPSQPANIVDTVGAGDSFTAAMVMGILKGFTLEEINVKANQIARFVCESSGATPRLPGDLVEMFNS